MALRVLKVYLKLQGIVILLFRIKSKISSKYGLSSQPRLVDIIAAVPQEYKKVLHVKYLYESNLKLTILSVLDFLLM